jgi:hypothetical protein
VINTQFHFSQLSTLVGTKKNEETKKQKANKSKQYSSNALFLLFSLPTDGVKFDLLKDLPTNGGSGFFD